MQYFLKKLNRGVIWRYDADNYEIGWSKVIPSRIAENACTCVDSRIAFMADVCDYAALYEKEGKRKRKLSEIYTSDLDFMAHKTLKNSKLNVLWESRDFTKNIEEIRSFTRVIVLSRANE